MSKRRLCCVRRTVLKGHLVHNASHACTTLVVTRLRLFNLDQRVKDCDRCQPIVYCPRCVLLDNVSICPSVADEVITQAISTMRVPLTSLCSRRRSTGAICAELPEDL